VSGLRLGHVGVLVEDCAAVAATLQSRLGLREVRGGIDAKVAAEWRWFRGDTGTALELLAPVADGPLRDYLDKHGPGLHHVSFEPTDFDDCLQRVESSGAQVLGLDRHHDGWEEFFLDPKETGGALLQVSRELAGPPLTDLPLGAQLFREVVRAWESGDTSKLEGLYVDSATYSEPVAGVLDGRERILRYMTKAIGGASYRFELHRELGTDAEAMIEWTMSFTIGDDTTTTSGVTIIETRDSRIARHIDYFDSHGMR
jgi:methylmalonyl-CoA/ethylmalonyl-CoA epimerase